MTTDDGNQDHEDNYVRLEFDAYIAEELREKFAEELAKAKPQMLRSEIEEESKLFVGTLECQAKYLPLFKSHEKQQRRRERLESFANALDSLIDAALKMDDPALGYAIWRGWMEISQKPDVTDEERAMVKRAEGHISTLFAYDLQNHPQDFALFALGVRKAVEELPPLDGSYTPENQLAKTLEDTLGRYGIPFTTSETGLAGMAYHAVMSLMGDDNKDAKYRLKIAVNNPESWRNFVKRIKLREEKNNAE